MSLSCAWLWPAQSARAFGELSRFEGLASAGGGGGRWFTGSPTDGHACAVCHVDPKPLDVEVPAFPERYTPALRYELELFWEPDGPIVALLEVTDERGVPAGSLEVALRDALEEPDLCRPLELRVGATKVFDGEEFPSLGPRQLLGFADCGARRARFAWIAPPEDIGTVTLVGGVVAPDDKPTFDQRDVLNDRVGLLRSWALSPSDAGKREGPKGCSVGGARVAPGSAWLLLGLGALRRLVPSGRPKSRGLHLATRGVAVWRRWLWSSKGRY